MLKKRLSLDRSIFNMEIPYLRKTIFILRQGPGYLLILVLLWRHRRHYQANIFNIL